MKVRPTLAARVLLAVVATTVTAVFAPSIFNGKLGVWGLIGAVATDVLLWISVAVGVVRSVLVRRRISELMNNHSRW